MWKVFLGLGVPLASAVLRELDVGTALLGPCASLEYNFSKWKLEPFFPS